ncbi:MAG: hypothetical protein JW731_06890 [Bacteroidales bacterium]|nr:hypothetical protein [Bacteroidales bacterium]
MKKITIIIVSVVLSFSFAFTQEQEEAKKEKDKPVYEPFGSGLLIDNQTSQIPAAKTLEMVIQHRFSTMQNNFEDLFGIYGSANIRMGFNYSILNNLMVGYGLTKKNMYNDFQVKWNVLSQTRQNTIPVFVTLYGNMAIDGRDKTVFEGAGDDSAYNFSNRFSYFSHLIIGRKFNDWLSLQVNTSFTHYNKVSAIKDHDVVGIGFNGRIKFSPQSAILFQYDMPLKIKNISEHTSFIKPSLPNFAIGYEVCTSTHDFQIYITTADGIIPQDIYMYNDNTLENSKGSADNDWTHGVSALRFGFTITRLWGF